MNLQQAAGGQPSDDAGAARVDVAAQIEVARHGDPAALAELFSGLRDYLLAIAQGELDADLRAKLGPSDLVQETFLQAQQCFLRFTGTTDSELKAWLRQILLHECLDVRNAFVTAKRDINRELPIDAPGSAIALIDGLQLDTSTPSARAIAGEQRARVAAALDRLPADYRQVVWLRNWQGLHFDAISREMGRSEAATRKLFARAIARLRELLNDTNEKRTSA